MIPFTREDQRYEYPLTKDSVVIDAGGHKGDFARRIAETYSSRVFVFEPVDRYFRACREALKHFPRVAVFPIGIGGYTRRDVFGIRGDSTGRFAAGESEDVDIRSIGEVLAELGLDRVALLKLNVEGSEYEILDAILAAGLAPRFDNIQVQFHDVIPEAVGRRGQIHDRLGLSHCLTYCTPFVWENWEIKK